MAGIFDPMHIGLVLGWHVIYIIAAVLFAKYMFSKEEVVFRS
jgi:sodium transport system permease protein